MNNKLQKKLVKLEALLYSAGRPIGLDDVKKVVGTKSDKVVLKIINELRNIYRERGSAFEIKITNNNRVFLQIISKFNHLIEGISNRPLLTIGPLKTLSYIAYNQPIKQTQIINERGSHVYSHIYKIEKLGLITRESHGRGGYIIKTTPFFADYFGFNHDPIKSKIQLQEIFNKLKITKIENGYEPFPKKGNLEFTEHWEKITELLSN